MGFLVHEPEPNTYNTKKNEKYFAKTTKKQFNEIFI